MNAGKPVDGLSVIDITALMAGDPAGSEAVAQEIGRAARETGFFYVRGHGCPPDLAQRLIARAAEFFALPLARKMDVYIGNSSNHRGYVPPGEEVFAAGTGDTKEAFDLSLDLPPQFLDGYPHPLLGPNQWPQVPGFNHDVTRYFAAVFAIGRRLMQAFARALGQPADFFDRYIGNPPSQLRLLRYPPNDASRDEPGIGEHTDYECFTLLLTTAPGLQVRGRSGAWLDAPPVPDAFAVNIGDMLEWWSGGAFVATPHRVCRVPQERYSFPLFFSVDYGTRVAPLTGGPGMIAGEHLYAQTVQTFRYLQERLCRREIALPRDARPLSSFGGLDRISQSRPARVAPGPAIR